MATARTSETNGENEGGARLTPSERRALLEDIGQIAFTLGQSSGAIASANPLPEEVIFASSARRLRTEAITSPLERLHLLAALWQEIQPALAAILRNTDMRLANHTPSVRFAQARGGPKTAQAVARSPLLAAAWAQLRAADFSIMPPAPAPGMEAASPGRSVAAHLSNAPVRESRPLLTANTWANCLVARILLDFARESAELGRLAAFCGAESEAQTALHLAKTARSLRAHPVLRHCLPLDDAEAISAQRAGQILRCGLPYQSLYGAWRQTAYPLDFDWTHSPLLTLPALEPWHLYEIWCLLQVASALNQAGWHLLRGDLLQATPRGLRLVPAIGRASRLDFQRREEEKKRRREEEGEYGNVEYGNIGKPKSKIENRKSKISSSLSLYYQPLFASANQRVGRSEGEGHEFAFGSRSHAMQPDMALHWRGRLYLLDPKFKPYAQIEDAQEDVNKMHAYRDAIVRRSSGKRSVASPVEAAWCLFPGQAPDEEATSVSNTVYAYPAASQESPFGTAGVGALRLRPGQATTTMRLAELLTFLLDSE